MICVIGFDTYYYRHGGIVTSLLCKELIIKVNHCWTLMHSFKRPLKHPVEHPNHVFASGCVSSWIRRQKARITNDYFSSRALRLPPLLVLLRVFCCAEMGGGKALFPVKPIGRDCQLVFGVLSIRCNCLPQQAEPRRLCLFIVLALLCVKGKSFWIYANTTAQRRNEDITNEHIHWGLSGATAPAVFTKALPNRRRIL